MVITAKYMEKGLFIVIDGTDGSGKATQLKILSEKLQTLGYQVETADFPRYGQKSAGLVEEYLAGNFGSATEVGPYRGSVFYAVDRYAASFEIRRWLAEGKIVISNRYVAANLCHQGGKIKDNKERSEYFKWLDNLEYNIFNIPRPDLNLILHVPAAVAQGLAEARAKQTGLAKQDIHETDLQHLEDAERVYLEVANTFPGFTLVECAQDGQIMPIEKIAEKVLEAVKENLERKK
jgi:dTMP kinase